MALDLFNRRKNGKRRQLKLAQEAYEIESKSCNRMLTELYEARKEASDFLAKLEGSIRDFTNDENLIMAFGSARDRIRKFDEVKLQERLWREKDNHQLNSSDIDSSLNLAGVVGAAMRPLMESTFGNNQLKSLTSALERGIGKDGITAIGQTLRGVKPGISLPLLGLLNPIGTIVLGFGVWNFMTISELTSQIKEYQGAIDRIQVFNQKAQLTIDNLKAETKVLKKAMDSKELIPSNEILRVLNKVVRHINKHFDI